MKNTRWIICFDFETDLPKPDICNPVELAAVPIDPETLEIRRDDSFNVIIRPPGINKEDYFTEDRNKTIAWHADHRECSSADIIEKWKSGSPQKTAWKNFCNYCKRYTVDKKPGQWYPEPISNGMNITGFDLPICRRLAEKHKTKMPISDVAVWDLYPMLQIWFENLPEPENLKMDTLRKFFGLPEHSNTHEALGDVYDTAEIFVRFLKFIRRQSSVGKFKGSFAKKRK